MSTDILGRVYEDGELILRQGEIDRCVYVVEDGQAEVVKQIGDRHVRLAVRGKGEFVGELGSLKPAPVSVRAVGRTRVLAVDKKNLLRRLYEDPALGLRLVQHLSAYVEQLTEEVARLKSA